MHFSLKRNANSCTVYFQLFAFFSLALKSSRNYRRSSTSAELYKCWCRHTQHRNRDRYSLHSVDVKWASIWKWHRRNDTRMRWNCAQQRKCIKIGSVIRYAESEVKTKNHFNRATWGFFPLSSRPLHADSRAKLCRVCVLTVVKEIIYAFCVASTCRSLRSKTMCVHTIKRIKSNITMSVGCAAFQHFFVCFSSAPATASSSFVCVFFSPKNLLGNSINKMWKSVFRGDARIISRM